VLTRPNTTLRVTNTCCYLAIGTSTLNHESCAILVHFIGSGRAWAVWICPTHPLHPRTLGFDLGLACKRGLILRRSRAHRMERRGPLTRACRTQNRAQYGFPQFLSARCIEHVVCGTIDISPAKSGCACRTRDLYTRGGFYCADTPNQRNLCLANICRKIVTPYGTRSPRDQATFSGQS
jgi:hypothetical protein